MLILSAEASFLLRGLTGQGPGGFREEALHQLNHRPNLPDESPKQQRVSGSAYATFQACDPAPSNVKRLPWFATAHWKESIFKAAGAAAISFKDAPKCVCAFVVFQMIIRLRYPE